MDSKIWLTPTELEEQFQIPAELVRRWAKELRVKGLARKSGYWLISPDAIPFLKSRVDQPGRVPIDSTAPDIRRVVKTVMSPNGSQSINAVATQLGVTWRKAKKLVDAYVENEQESEPA